MNESQPPVIEPAAAVTTKQRKPRTSKPKPELNPLDLLKADEAAEILTISRAQVLVMYHEGRLPGVKVLNSYRFFRADVMAQLKDYNGTRADVIALLKTAG